MNAQATSPEGIEYRMDDTGTIHQLDPQPYRYDADYIARTYGTIPREALTSTNHLRLGYILGALPVGRKKLLDWGYGSGAFLRAAASMSGVEGLVTYGYEINGLPLPAGAHACKDPMAEAWDVVCFFDVLEHIHDLSFLAGLRTRYLVVTVPCCHARRLDWEWFWTWKHRKPNEHVHHWGGSGLANTLKQQGYKIMTFGAPEDATRKGADPALINILTMVAQKV